MPFDPNDPHPDEIPAYKYPPTSNFGREMRKWDRRKSEGGMNADGFEKFPMMLHRAQNFNGKWVTARPEPDYDQTFRNEAAWDRECKIVAKWNDSCQRIVHTHEEYERVRSNGEGWRDTPTQALEYREALETEISNAAAERAITDRKMSPEAQAEAREADESTADHLAEIPRKSVGRRGRTAAA